MNIKQFIGIVFLLLVIIVILFIIISYVRFNVEIPEAYSRLSDKTSRVIETEYGQIEFTSYGRGYPVIFVHGIWGGFDQGLSGAKGLFGDNYQVIIPSRFGYLKTSLPENASAALQSDEYAALLDELNIKKAVIAGESAGGTSAIQFALRHPDRCSALILISTHVPENQPPPSGIGRMMMNTLSESDFLLWLIITYSPSTMMSTAGIPKDLQINMTQENLEAYTALSQTFLPTIPRSKGIMFDAYTSNPEIDSLLFENITVPTLLFHAKDDPMPPYTSAQKMAERIPNAKFVGYEKGGHLLLGHDDEIKEETDRFISKIITTNEG